MFANTSSDLKAKLELQPGRHGLSVSSRRRCAGFKNQELPINLFSFAVSSQVPTKNF